MAEIDCGNLTNLFLLNLEDSSKTSWVGSDKDQRLSRSITSITWPISSPRSGRVIASSPGRGTIPGNGSCHSASSEAMVSFNISGETLVNFHFPVSKSKIVSSDLILKRPKVSGRSKTRHLSPGRARGFSFPSSAAPSTSHMITRSSRVKVPGSVLAVMRSLKISRLTIKVTVAGPMQDNPNISVVLSRNYKPTHPFLLDDGNDPVKGRWI